MYNNQRPGISCAWRRQKTAHNSSESGREFRCAWRCVGKSPTFPHVKQAGGEEIAAFREADSHDTFKRINHGENDLADGSSRGNELAYGGGTNQGSNNVPERQRPLHFDRGKGTTYCLLLSNYLLVVWMLGCLRFLAPRDEDKRYFASAPELMTTSFAILYNRNTWGCTSEFCALMWTHHMGI